MWTCWCSGAAASPDLSALVRWSGWCRIPSCWTLASGCPSSSSLSTITDLKKGKQTGARPSVLYKEQRVAICLQGKQHVGTPCGILASSTVWWQPLIHNKAEILIFPLGGDAVGLEWKSLIGFVEVDSEGKHLNPIPKSTCKPSNQ